MLRHAKVHSSNSIKKRGKGIINHQLIKCPGGRTFSFKSFFKIISGLQKKKTNGASSSPTDLVSEPEVVGNAVVVKVEPNIEEDSYEMYPITAIGVSPEVAKAVPIKVEEVFDWLDNKNDGEDEISY